RYAYYGWADRINDQHKNCKAVRDFLVAQKEARVIKIALNAGVVGIPFYMAYAAARSIYKRATGTIHQARADHAQHLVRDALPALDIDDQLGVTIVEPGCKRAQALIALLCGELDLKNPNGTAANYPRTMEALMHPDGWGMIATALSAAVIKDAGSGKFRP